MMPTTQIVELDFTNLARLDEGRIDKLLRYHLQRIAMDCVARPGDNTARKVTLEFVAKPVIDPDTGECMESRLEIECKSKMPTHRSKPYSMLVSNQGFKFNQDFPDEVDQPSLYQGDEE